MNIALLVLRVIVGGLFVGHGTQKPLRLVLCPVAFAVTAIGAGRYSLDHVFSLHFATLGWALAGLAAGILAAVVTVAASRFEHHHHSSHATATAA